MSTSYPFDPDSFSAALDALHAADPAFFAAPLVHGWTRELRQELAWNQRILAWAGADYWRALHTAPRLPSLTPLADRLVRA